MALLSEFYLKNNIKAINEHYRLENENISHPTNYKTIMQYQQKDKELIKITQKFYTEYSWGR